MIKWVSTLVAVMFVYLGYVIWQSCQEVKMDSPAPVVIAKPMTLERVEPIAAASRAPAATSMAAPVQVAPARVAVASPTPELNLAPEGTYFLIQRVSIMTDLGVVGEPPGTRVTMVDAGPPMRVTDGKNEFEVQRRQVTNDYDVATLALNADRDAQSSLSAMNALQAKEFMKEQSESQAAWEAKERALGATYPQPFPMAMGELNQGPKSVSLINGGGSFRSAVH